jgi:glycyl-tRNA synthetase beta subunit
MICNSFFLRELDYFLRFISNLNKIFTIVEIKNKKYYMPTKFLTIANQKSDDCKKIISNIEKIIRYI